MAVRKTESRLPAGFQPSDLGQALASADGHCILVSCFTEPLVAGYENSYVIFVTDPGLAAAAASYRWTFSLNGNGDTPRNTDTGIIFEVPRSLGTLAVEASVLDAGGTALAVIQLEQEVVEPCAELEARIADAAEQPGAGVGDPVSLRELVNQYSLYYQQVTPSAAEDPAALRRFTFMVAMNGAVRRTRFERRRRLDELASALNDATADFAQLAASGVGVCEIRPVLLAMTGNAGAAPLLPWAELPERNDQRALGDENLRLQLGAMPEPDRIDLYNILRFPKTNVTHCARILEALRDRYFGGTDFTQVLTELSGTRAFWILRHYVEGPLRRG
jgi:hypothetical protein